MKTERSEHKIRIINILEDYLRKTWDWKIINCGKIHMPKTD